MACFLIIDDYFKPLLINKQAIISPEKPLLINKQAIISPEKPLLINKQAIISPEKPLLTAIFVQILITKCL
jgi:SET domain-containing protein